MKATKKSATSITTNNLTDIRVPKEFNRRATITDEIKEEVLSLHRNGYTLKQIKGKVQISERSIQYIIDPQKQINDKLKRQQRDKTHYKQPTTQEIQERNRAYKNYRLGIAYVQNPSIAQKVDETTQRRKAIEHNNTVKVRGFTGIRS